MAKKKATPVVKVKDPKKQKAGKARAAKSLRINGRFTSNRFLEDITDRAVKSGYKNPYDYFRENEAELSALYDKWMEGVDTYDYRFMQEVRDFKGAIIVNDREVKKSTALLKIMAMNQVLKIDHNVAAWFIKPFHKISKGIKFYMPFPEDITDMQTEDLEDFLSGLNIGLIISEKKNYIGNFARIKSGTDRYKRYRKNIDKDAKK